jgi:hypothetical protein
MRHGLVILQPPRRSYERPLRLYQESHSDDSLSEDEASSRKRSKRSKKAKVEVSSDGSGHVFLVPVMSTEATGSLLTI